MLRSSPNVSFLTPVPDSFAPVLDLLPTPSPPHGVSLLVHGGAWEIPDDVLREHEEGIDTALAMGREVLLGGASALDVVVRVVAWMENSGIFDAGRGAVLTLDGTVELDAACMCGATGGVGSVIGMKAFANPIEVAHALLQRGRGETRVLAGEGAETFATAAGFSPVAPASLVHPREQARYEALLAERTFAPGAAFRPRPSGTVGCVARDRQGRLAAATSTGGTPLKPPGRVGDSPLPGSGLYASDEGAVSCTGWGEALLSRVTALRALHRLDEATAGEAAQYALSDLHHRVQNYRGEAATGGLILLTPAGDGVAAFTTARMARAGWAEGGHTFRRVTRL